MRNPGRLTKKNILKYIQACAAVLDEQNVPKGDRWIAIDGRILRMKTPKRIYLEIRVVVENGLGTKEKRITVSDGKTIAKLRCDRGYLGRLLRGVC